MLKTGSWRYVDIVSGIEYLDKQGIIDKNRMAVWDGVRVDTFQLSLQLIAVCSELFQSELG